MDFLEKVFQLVHREFLVIGASALPVFELKASIPLGLSMGLNPWLTVFLAVTGALIPAPFLLMYLRPVLLFIARIKYLKPFAKWLVKRSVRRSGTIKKYSLIGLFIFVMVPLPTTGVWTGCIIASLLGLQFKPAFTTVMLGTLACGLIVLGLSYQMIQ